VHRQGIQGAEAVKTEMKIFVVDDDPSLQRFVERWLASFTGHEVVYFDNGAAAIEALARVSPCILVSDLDMPGLSGEEVARAAARLQHPPRIVLMSGDYDRLERAQTLAHATLEKPFALTDLLATLEPAPCYSTSPAMTSTENGRKR
jgi:DNA-binding NtrC family response regulator